MNALRTVGHWLTLPWHLAVCLYVAWHALRAAHREDRLRRQLGERYEGPLDHPAP